MKLPVSLRDLAPLEVVDPSVARAYLRAAVACCALGLVLSLWQHAQGRSSGTVLAVMLALELGMGAAFLALDRVRTPGLQARGLLAALAAASLALTVLAQVRGEGLLAVEVALFPIVVCGGGVLLGLRAGLVLAAVSALGIVGLVPHTPQAALAGGVAIQAPARALAALFHLACALGVAFVAGQVMRRLL
jgi:hypothetical protein